MNARKFRTAILATILVLVILLLLPACDGTETPPAKTATPPPTLPIDTTPPVVTVKQELEEQLDMLRALAEAEKGRGKDVSLAEGWLDEAGQALQSDDLVLAREKLRQAGATLGVKLP